MKKTLIFVLCFLLLFAAACTSKEENYYSTSGNYDASVPNQTEQSSVTAAASDESSVKLEKDETPTPSKNSTSVKASSAVSSVVENQADAGDLFGPATSSHSSSSVEQSTTPKPPQTTQESGVLLPKTGYDPDGRGRILVGRASVSNGTVSLQLKNVTSKWMTEETSFLEYTCYNKNGEELKKDVWNFGALEAGKDCTCEISLPKNTAEVRITAFKATYWMQWKE